MPLLYVRARLAAQESLIDTANGSAVMMVNEVLSTLMYMLWLRRDLINGAKEANECRVRLQGADAAGMPADERAALREKVMAIRASRPRRINLVLLDIEMDSVVEMTVLLVFFAMAVLGDPLMLANMPKNLVGLTMAERAAKLGPGLAVQLAFELLSDFLCGSLTTIVVGDSARAPLGRGAKLRVLLSSAGALSAAAHFSHYAGAGCGFCEPNTGRCPLP